MRDERGFTLTELLVAMPILALLLAAVAGLLMVTVNGNAKTTGQLAEQSTYFPILDSMVQDLRTAMPPTLGGSAIVSATSTSIVFYSPDTIYATTGATSPFHLREVAYQFANAALQKQSVTSTNTFTTVTATTPWGNWTSPSGTFPLASFPTSTGWTTLLGKGVTQDGSSPAIVSASLTYYDGSDDLISSPVSSANLGLIRTIVISVTATNGSSATAQTTYNNTATIRETQPSS